MKTTYYGHSCFSVEIKGKKLLFDPFITPNEKASGIDIRTIEADYVLLSHAHEDHIADAETILKQTSAVLVSNFEIVSWYEKKGINNFHPMNHGGTKKFDFGSVKYVNAIHSSVLPDGSYGGNPGGFVITSEEGNFYFAGDTALTYDMKLIAEQFNLDFAVLPIGDNFTMGVDDAVLASDFIQCNNILGVHFDTFGYIVIDHKEALRKFEAKNKKLHLLKIGDSINL